MAYLAGTRAGLPSPTGSTLAVVGASWTPGEAAVAAGSRSSPLTMATSAARSAM